MEEQDAHSRVIEAHADVVRALAEMTTVDDVLRTVAAQLCDLLGANRCSLYLRDPDTGVFRGRVGHAAADIDARVRRLVAGVEADGFTREILATGATVLIDDARLDPRPIRSAMRDWGVRSMLGIPLLHRGEVVGLAFVDDDAERHRFTEADRAAGQEFATLAAGAIKQAVANATTQESLRAAARQNRLLRQAAALDEALTGVALRGGGIADILGAVSERTGKPVVLLDAHDRPIGACGAPALGTDPALGGEDAVRLVDPAPGAGRPHRLLVADVVARDERLGRLVLAETGTGLTALDRHAARRAAALFALELSAERRIVAAERDSRAAFVSDLVRGDRDPTWLTRRGQELGVDLAEPHVLCLIHAGEAQLDRSDVATQLAQRLGHGAIATAALGDAVACLLPVPDGSPATAVEDARVAILGALEDAPAGVIAALSEPWTSAQDAQHAHAQAEQTLRCLRTLGTPEHRPRVLSTRDLGAGRLFLASADPREAAGFADRMLGALLAPDAAPELLETVQAFLAGSRSVRVAAVGLGVHENTIRYRLSRVHDLTGLDVGADSDDQLTAQLALRVLQLQGRAPWTTPRAAATPADDGDAPALALVS